MKKLGYILLPVFVFAFAAAADAQKIDTHQDRGETLKVTVTGQVNFDGIFRAEELTSARGSASVVVAGEDEWTVEGYIRLRLDIELSEKINAVVSLRNQRLTSGGTNHFGDNPETSGVIFDEASITLNELFNPALKLTIGIVPVAFDLRGRGSAFFFDPAHSQPFGSGFAGGEDELQPTGVHGVYSKDAFSLGVFLLPAIIEGGRATDDESAYGVWFMYALDSIGKGSRIGAIIAADSFAGHNTAVYTIGLGIDWHGLTEGLELYAEIYFQFGDAGQAVILGVTEDIDAGGFGLSIGGQYNFQTDNNIWIGLNLTWVSGSDDADEAGWLSYENVNDLKILEDQWFGMDLDTNYFSFKIMAGLAFTVGSGAMKNNLELSLIIGINSLDEDVGVGAAATDEIGHEIDVNARLWASKQLSFHTTIGFLFSSEVLEDVLLNEDDSTFLWVLGADLKY